MIPELAFARCYGLTGEELDLINCDFTCCLGRDTEEDVTDLELVSPEQGGRSGTDQGTGDLQEVRFGSGGDGSGQFAGFGFLGGGEGFLHGRSSDDGGDSFGDTLVPRLVYKKCTNLRDAHTSATRAIDPPARFFASTVRRCASSA